MRAVKYLEQVKDLDSKVERLRALEVELWTLATSMTQGLDGMPHATGVKDKMTPSVDKIIKARERTNAKIDEYVDVRLDVMRHIEMLPTRQCEALDLLYVRKREKRTKGQSWYYSWSEIAYLMGCTEQNVSKLRNKGIKNLQKILDSEEKTVGVD
jgi:DNA-directed RNA polymerase specialized sigma subunit